MLNMEHEQVSLKQLIGQGTKKSRLIQYRITEAWVEMRHVVNIISILL